MPRVAGVSGSSDTRPILLSRSPTRVSRWLWWRREGLPVCSTLIILPAFLLMSNSYSAVCSASPPSRRRACSADTLMLRRAATERGESWRLSASKVARAMSPGDVVMERAALAQRHPDQAALGGLGRLADRLRHLARFAVAEADATLLVADHHARGNCQRLDASVKEIAAAVEDDFLDALGRRALRQQLAHRLGGVDVGAGLLALTHGLLERGGRRQRLAFDVVDHLGVDVLGRAEHRKPRATTGGAPDVPPHLRRPPQRPINDCCHRQLPLFLLAFLAEDELARILHALALVGLRLAKRPDLGRRLTDLLRIDAGDDDLGRLRHHDRDPLRNRIDDVVRIAELQLQILALQSGTIADAADLELALVALGDALDQLGHQGAIGPPHGARLLGLIARIDAHTAALELGRHVAVQNELQGALRAFHLDGLALDIGGHARRDGDRLFADTRHGVIPFVAL